MNTNVITIEKNIPIPAILHPRGSAEKYNFIKDMEINDSFKINGATPDFSPVGVRAHVYGLNSNTDRSYTIRTVSGHSSKPNAIRVWRVR
tara:strand:- start:354 stop:623 length:270 start_codon:yes stop_codon:yes gene_type:complete